MSIDPILTPENKFPLGQRVALPGHFLEPVTLEAIRFIGSGYECRVRLGDGTPDEAILSLEEAAALAGQVVRTQTAIQPADAEKLRLLIESARIRLAYAHDRQFAVSLSGIRTLPHQIEAVYQRMLPQPRLRFLLADDPGAGKTIMAGLLIKELKLREAIERVLILSPSPLTRLCACASAFQTPLRARDNSIGCPMRVCGRFPNSPARARQQYWGWSTFA